jgi:hypothetical protein
MRALPRRAAVAVLVVAVPAAGGLFHFGGESVPEPPAGSHGRAAPCGAATHPCLPPPDTDEALRELFGESGAGGGTSLSDSAMASVAMARQIDRDGDSYYLVIAGAQQPEPRGAAAARRFGRGTALGALIYRWSAEGWRIEAKAPFIGEFGDPGQFGGGWEPEDTDLIRVGPRKLALLLCSTYLLPRSEGSRGGLFELRRGELSPLGYVELSERNTDSCARGAAARLLGKTPCYGYEGRLTPRMVAGSEYYDLVIDREGTVLDDPRPAANGKGLRPAEAVAASALVYRYRDGAYRTLEDARE